MFCSGYDEVSSFHAVACLPLLLIQGCIRSRLQPDRFVSIKTKSIGARTDRELLIEKHLAEKDLATR